MQLPTERISLNRRENAVIRTGLNRILSEFTDIRYRGRVTPQLWNPVLKDKLQPRALAPWTQESIFALRNRLASVAGKDRAKYRFNVVEYAILAFATRVARRFANNSVPEELLSKLETYRKRAKRRAITLCGAAVYQQVAHEWACSARWIRFNLLPLPARTGHLLNSSRIYREQFQQMLMLSLNVTAERCTEPMEEQELRRSVGLIIREIRRGRQRGVKVRQLLGDEQKAENFLFEVLKKKNPDLKLKFEFKSLDQQQAERAERFRAALVVDPGNFTPAGPNGLRYPDNFVVYRLTRFLRERVNRQFWEEVAAVAAAIAKNSKAIKPEDLMPATLTLDEVLRASTPAWDPRLGTGEVEHFAAWLLHFLLQCGATPDKAVQMFKQSVKLASQIPPNQRS